MELGATILTLRLQRGLTQEGLALEAETNAGYISRIERGKSLPSLIQLQKIATALGTSMGAILTEAEGPLFAAPQGLVDQSGEAAADAAQLRLGFLELSEEHQQLAIRFVKMLGET